MQRIILLILVCLSVSFHKTIGQTSEKATSSWRSIEEKLKSRNETDIIPAFRNCITVESEQRLREKNPKRLTDQEFEMYLSKHIAAKRNGAARSFVENVVLKIPTIVHVIHNGEPVGVGSNISQEQVMSQFEVLNEDFRKTGGGYNEHPLGADVMIEFVPAVLDPNGKVLEEPGIDRQLGYEGSYTEGIIQIEVKPNTIWNPDEYLNIWTLNLSGGVVAYAQFPTMSGLPGIPPGPEDYSTDGVVVGYRYFGRTGNIVPPYHLGKSLSHELGHWLGLRHIWGDNSDCLGDDFCADTPPTSGPNYSCKYRDSCTEDDLPDMVENFMDYSTDPCLTTFTEDQKTRMRTVLEVSPRRRSLLSCQLATEAVAGLNSAVFSATNKSWFEYTDDGTGQVLRLSSIGLTEEDTRVSLFSECNTVPIVVNDNSGGTSQSQISIQLQPHQTIKIQWEGLSFTNFDWTLEIEEPGGGKACRSAVAATLGDNIIPEQTAGLYWYRFKPAATNQAIVIQPNGSFYTVYSNSCDALSILKSGNEDQTIYGIGRDEEIFIAFEGTGDEVRWQLTTIDAAPSQSCAGALTPAIGINTVQAGPTWYKYTVPYRADIKITTEWLSHARVFKGCGGQLLAETDPWAERTDIRIRLNKNDVITIVWDEGYNAEPFEWDFNVDPFTGGEICQIAIPAVQGVNTAPDAPQWFKYTTTKATNLRITSKAFTSVDTHVAVKRSCNGQFVAQADNPDGSDQAELILYGLTEGETLFIYWTEKWSYEGFDWLLEEIDPLPGDNCKSLAEARLGNNTIKMKLGHKYEWDYYWSRFVVPANAAGKKLVAILDLEGGAFLTPNCNYLQIIDQGYQKVQWLNPIPGQEIIIVWSTEHAVFENYGRFTYYLGLEDIQDGDFCSDAVPAVQGMNTVPYAPFSFEYTMTQNGSLRVTSMDDTDINTELYILDGCDGEVRFASTDFDGQAFLKSQAFLSGLKKGDKFIIEWNRAQDYRGFPWKLEELPSEPGDHCSDALIAHTGINHSAYATKWYKYTVEKAGRVRITSLALTETDTRLFVYDGCDGNLLGKSEDVIDIMTGDPEYYQSDLVLEDREAGEEIFIRWDGRWSYAPFSWKIINGDSEQGDSCEDPLPAHEGLNNTNREAPVWFTFTMPRTTSLIISSLHTTGYDTELEIYDDCSGEPIAFNFDWNYNPQAFAYLEEVEAGQTILIRWNTGYRHNYAFDWNIIVGEPEPGLYSQNPMEAHVGTNTIPDFNSDYFWYTFTVPESNKKLRISTTTDEVYSVLVLNDIIGDTWSSDPLIVYGYSSPKKVDVMNLEAGQQIYIAWTASYPGVNNGFDWLIEILEPGEGDLCEQAKPVNAGSIVTQLPGWTTFTATRTGMHTLTNIVDDSFAAEPTRLYVYAECGGELIAFNDNIEEPYFSQASRIELDMLEGETIYIMWEGEIANIDNEFKWRIIPPNEHPVVSDTLFSLDAMPVNGQEIGILEAEDGDDDPLYYSIAAGNELGVFSLDESTGIISIADAGEIDQEEYVLHVEVTDNYHLAKAQVSIFIPLVPTSAEDDIDSHIHVYPNPARSSIKLKYPSHHLLRQVDVVDFSGRVVRTKTGTTESLDVSDLKSGIYYVRLLLGNKHYFRKVAIIHE